MNSKPYPFEKISRMYHRHHQKIMDAEDHQFGIHVYSFDWPMLFTPIETAMWSDIRYAGLVMYPQYPIGRFFADFANPKKKIVVECDGKAFHSPEKDRQRDSWMIGEGWRVFRVPGKACIQPEMDWSDFCYAEDFEQQEMLDKWVDSGESLISALGYFFFDKQKDSMLVDTLHRAIQRYEVRGLYR